MKNLYDYTAGPIEDDMVEALSLFRWEGTERVLEAGSGPPQGSVTTWLREQAGLVVSIDPFLEDGRGLGWTTVHGAVVGTATENVDIVRSSEWWNSTMMGKPQYGEEEGVLTVPAYVLADVVSDGAFDTVVLDIEGAEAEALAGGLPRVVRRLIVEVHDHFVGEDTWKDVERVLERDGLLRTRVVDGGDNHPSIYVYEREGERNGS